ncbi:ROK family protein (plasmid) [Limimaricola variabilis]|uniref:ROK family protein n=1 Tax=Limimaricola variabilis TaxID=1492771 RepID=UPI002AC8F5DE|nr:ROK family protein [Limimaricola variabilis]WPY96426.1 ROK family protein [Limimaricola variabilis]
MTGPVLAIDQGGTKLLCALVEAGHVIEQVTTPTERKAGPEAWLDAAARLAAPWQGRFERVGIAVTGRVSEGMWSALNPGTLSVPEQTPYALMAEARLNCPVTLANDAQAAAWGEFLHGAGEAQDMVYLTISTGIGGGIVVGGRLLSGRSGLAGHAGQMRGLDLRGALVEDQMSGRWIAQAAALSGHDTDARGVFEAAGQGAGWAEEIVSTAAARAAALCADLQMLIDPPRIVIGGGVGLAPGFLDRIRAGLSKLPEPLRPDLRVAALGGAAGIIGIAGLAGHAGT